MHPQSGFPALLPRHFYHPPFHYANPSLACHPSDVCLVPGAARSNHNLCPTDARHGKNSRAHTADLGGESSTLPASVAHTSTPVPSRTRQTSRGTSIKSNQAMASCITNRPKSLGVFSLSLSLSRSSASERDRDCGKPHLLGLASLGSPASGARITPSPACNMQMTGLSGREPTKLPQVPIRPNAHSTICK